jgi:hypothetical protein
MPNVCLPFRPETRKAAARKLICLGRRHPVIEQPIHAISCDTTPSRVGIDDASRS